MLALTDPPNPDQSLAEIATIFAEAILRLKSRHRLPSETSLNSPRLAAECLEFPADSRLTVPRG